MKTRTKKKKLPLRKNANSFMEKKSKMISLSDIEKLRRRSDQEKQIKQLNNQLYKRDDSHSDLSPFETFSKENNSIKFGNSQNIKDNFLKYQKERYEMNNNKLKSKSFNKSYLSDMDKNMGSGDRLIDNISDLHHRHN